MAESVFERREKYNAERRMTMNKIKKVTTGAVCCCIVALLGVGVFNGTQITTNDTPNIGIQNLQGNKEETAKEEVGNEQNVNPIQNVEDVPADSNGEINSGDLTKDTSEFFCGSYTDSNGKFVIVLTENTQENRIAICKELGRSESNTTFVTGTYTLAYLTELQTKISNAMTNKEFPFVTSSVVDEIGNRIKVRVTTDNQTDLEKVRSLDSIGGAIVIEKSAGISTEDLLSIK
ncbi:MAG: hypothetical protein J6B37_01365 [Clostridia bacterium]|nr:hypothetical protein [Clostridia bacterium]